MDTPPEDMLASSWIEVDNDEPGDAAHRSRLAQQQSSLSRHADNSSSPPFPPHHLNTSDSDAPNYEALRDAMIELGSQEASQEDERPSRNPTTADVMRSDQQDVPPAPAASGSSPSTTTTLSREEDDEVEMDPAAVRKYRTTIEDAPAEEEVADMRRDLAKRGIDLDPLSDGSSVGSSLAPGILNDFVASLFTPGTNPGVIFVMNLAFFALFATLVGLAVLTRGNLYVLVFLAISVGLFASIHWFLLGIKRTEDESKAKVE